MELNGIFNEDFNEDFKSQSSLRIRCQVKKLTLKHFSNLVFTYLLGRSQKIQI